MSSPTAAPAPGLALLDNPAWASLTGPHAALAVGDGPARRYAPDVSPFAGLADPLDARCWDALAGLVPEGDAVVVTGPGVVAAPGWQLVEHVPGVQLVATRPLDPGPTGDLRRLDADDPADVAAMLDLTSRTRPGPFLPRTATLGTYLGLRAPDGTLVAMAGERLHPAGWTEISAVCTDPAWQGRGYAARLVAAVAAGVVARGERVLLHTGADNTRAIRLYEHLGFALRTTTSFVLVTPQEHR
ncbi:ribosomal protein S18 acetylase RimI-like enzyme [Nocardioides zeae]|uniref:Ribosomal protein S18 acetylase RimI-like enzyme n=1 Tax=Nocardioides zeae TaxID=1457234 RepID=A0ACC6IMS9_9ACTN|nr:GNAT family N-acetyltransferase [Nocardioides zeae]MDR6173369.1 ribosomal protein S18 acetylase RimI-like enzyme [Nocardioides zeae]MDR6212009.1 ribosomal protein S18 acetylase RimI-like enzyme [Nocardioides zeae]